MQQTISTAQYWTTVRREPLLVAYWRGNDVGGVTQAQDSGAKYDLVGSYQASQTLGPPLLQADTSAGSMTLNSSTANGFTVTDVSELEITGDVSVEFWLAPSSSGQSCHLLGKLDSTSTYAAPYALRLSSGALKFSQGNGSGETSVSGGTPSVAIPSHVVATSFRGAMTIYLNGSVVATGSLGSQTVSDGGESLIVGALSGHLYAGLMSEVAVYSSALSATRVARHFALGQQIYPDVAHYLGVDAPVLVS